MPRSSRTFPFGNHLLFITVYLPALKNLFDSSEQNTNSSHYFWVVVLTGGLTVEPTGEQLNGKNKGFQVSILNHTLKY